MLIPVCSISKIINMITPSAEKIIKNHVILSAGISAIPLAYFNLNMVKRIQMDMIRQLCRVYGKSYYDVHCKAYIGALASIGLAKKGLSYTRGIFGIRNIMSSVSHAGFSAASTYAVGRVTARFFQDNIELSDINMDMAKAIFLEELEKGKTLTDIMFKKNKEQKENRLTEEDIYNQLIELKELKDSGAISEEVYETLRKKYLKEMNINI